MSMNDIKSNNMQRSPQSKAEDRLIKLVSNLFPMRSRSLHHHDVTTDLDSYTPDYPGLNHLLSSNSTSIN